MDEEIKKLLKDYIEQINDKEESLTSFKKAVDEITFDARKEMDEVLKNLESRFEANEISEEEYLDFMRKEKAAILQKTEQKLNSLARSIKEV